jgi:2-C-methyl-D-erythritol 4-phosphate cytidylyltransferase/2-C-methyl-D-erythritol 2,4-cyclodiphosphate synthase
VVLVHDGARPLVSPGLLAQAVAEAAAHGSAVAALPVIDTLKRAPDGQHVTGTVDRTGLWAVQTPQAFRRELLCEAHRRAAQEGYRGTDEASLVEHSGHPVRLIPGERTNLKITLPEDFIVAEALLQAPTPPLAPMSVSCRVGWGYDIHRLVPGRPLWLGGVCIPFEKGLAGHSDADALLHAIADALLGALNAGDLGQHFPDTDERYRDAASLDLLRQVAELMRQEGYAVGNVDAMILAEAPRLAPYRAAMQECIAAALRCAPEQISLKATTCEGLGAIGAGQGIAAQAVVILYRV